MTKEKIFGFIKLLIDKTESEEIKWNKEKENTFSVLIKNNSVLIRYVLNLSLAGRSTIQKISYIFKIINSSNEVIYSLNPKNDLVNIEYYELLRNLYEVVKNKYLNVDKTLDDMINDLN